MTSDLTDTALRCAILAQERAEAAAAKAAHVLAEAEELAEDGQGDRAEVDELRAAWEAAEAAAEAARLKRREAEAATPLAEALAVYSAVYWRR